MSLRFLAGRNDKSLKVDPQKSGSLIVGTRERGRDRDREYVYISAGMQG